MRLHDPLGVHPNLATIDKRRLRCADKVFTRLGFLSSAHVQAAQVLMSDDYGDEEKPSATYPTLNPKPHPSKPHPSASLNLTPLNPTPATCHKRKRKLRCSFRSAALQELHCNIGFSAVRKSFGPKAALQQAKNRTATSKKLRCRKVALSCRFPAGFKPPRLGTHVSDLLNPCNLSGTGDSQRDSRESIRFFL